MITQNSTENLPTLNFPTSRFFKLGFPTVLSNCTYPFGTIGAVLFSRNTYLDDEQSRFGKELRKIYGDFMWNRQTILSKMDDLDKNEVNLLSYDPENGGQTKMEVTTTFKVCTELDKMDFYTLV